MMRFGNESTHGAVDNRYINYHPMMGWAGGGNNTFWFFSILCFVTWILIIILLIALIRWLWKKGDKVK